MGTVIWLRKLGGGERVVVVVALGVALGIAGEYIVGSLNTVGWVAYAPLSAVTVARASGVPTWADYLIWLGITGLWAALSIGVLRAAPSRPPDSP